MQSYNIDYELRTLKNLDLIYVPKKASSGEEIRRIAEVHAEMEKELVYFRRQAERNERRARFLRRILIARKITKTQIAVSTTE